MTITVYHLDHERLYEEGKREDYLDAMMSPAKKHIQMLIHAGYYKKTALVETTNLSEAFQLTNSIDCYWGENKEVTLFTEKNRSTSVGDLLVKDEKPYYIHTMSYELLDENDLQALKDMDKKIKNKATI